MDKSSLVVGLSAGEAVQFGEVTVMLIDIHYKVAQLRILAPRDVEIVRLGKIGTTEKPKEKK